MYCPFLLYHTNSIRHLHVCLFRYCLVGNLEMVFIFEYRKQGKIRWAKYSWFQPYKFLWKCFCGALASGVYYLTIAKSSLENFRGTLKTAKV